MSFKTTLTVRDASLSATDRVHDVDAIRCVVAAIEETQRSRDADRFMQLLGRDAVWVTAFGKRLTGWEEINSFTQKVLTPALDDQLATYEIAHVTFLSDTVAAVNVHQRPVDKEGTPIRSEPEGRPLYVMKKEHGTWIISVGQNTKFQAESIDAQSKEIANR
ncbi:SgcJ/EcaC family oxidoreductase [Microvirga roseola]|uniref:SgcJ/EcaC family oxidoreductase n=1 Tax=Microvirga roseola TaxID=2883126 RepID=UPI001E638114|nr:SgcJ/EcaC family oxidoreductase [Microvirga roseola]